MIKYAAPLFALTLAFPAFGETLTLTPADPQPSKASLASGLAVSYAYGGPVKLLAQAEKKLKDAKPGAPLVGLSYLDGDENDLPMTATKAQKVSAAISGFIKFDAAGTFDVEFISNDGIEARIGGQQVAFYDGVHGCESAGVTSVKVPEAGYYALEATYFQRKGTACLLMDWNITGDEMEPVPDEAFVYLK